MLPPNAARSKARRNNVISQGLPVRLFIADRYKYIGARAGNEFGSIRKPRSHRFPEKTSSLSQLTRRK